MHYIEKKRNWKRKHVRTESRQRGEKLPRRAIPPRRAAVTAEGGDTEALKAEVKRLQDLYLRTLADAENFKKRINEERIRERKYAAQPIWEKLITVIDIFDQAIPASSQRSETGQFLTDWLSSK